MYVRQTEIAARMSKCKSLVVNAQQMQDGCMEVMDRAAVLDRVIAILVSFAVTEATSYASPRHPHCKALRMMVSAYFACALLDGGCPSKLATPDDECIIQQSS